MGSFFCAYFFPLHSVDRITVITIFCLYLIRYSFKIKHIEHVKKFILLLLTSISACYGQVSVTESMSNRILSHLKKGQTDSLFMDIQRCYEMAGWELNKPRPRLEKQDYLQPLSMTSDERILQTELMSKKKQGYVYWQNWSNLIADSTWNVKAAFPTSKEAYLVGNYTIMLIMAHELGHYYSEANDLRRTSAEWENIADHFTIAFLNELAEVNPELRELKLRFEQKVVNDLYMAVKPELRTSIPQNLSLYEYVFHFALPSDNEKYVTLQLARESRLLKNTGFYLNNFMSFFEKGQRAVLNAGSFIPYSGHYELIELSSDMNVEVLNEYASYAPLYDIRVMNDGELCVISTYNDTVLLEVLTPQYQTYSYSIAGVKDELKSIIGNDICDPEYSSGHMELFTEPGKMIVTAIQKSSRDSSSFHIIHVDLQSQSITSHQVIKDKKYAFNMGESGDFKKFWQNNMTNGVPQIIFYPDELIRIVKQVDSKWASLKVKYDEDKPYYSHTLDGADKGFAMYRFNNGSGTSPLSISEDGTIIWQEPTNNTMFKIKKEDQIYTLNANFYGEQIGVPFDTWATPLGVWSPKYGFLFFDPNASEVFGLKIH